MGYLEYNNLSISPGEILGYHFITWRTSIIRIHFWRRKNRLYGYQVSLSLTRLTRSCSATMVMKMKRKLSIYQLGTESSRQQILDNSWEIGCLQDQRGRGGKKRVHLPRRGQHPHDNQGLLHRVALQLRDGQLSLWHTGKVLKWWLYNKEEGYNPYEYVITNRDVQWF